MIVRLFAIAVAMFLSSCSDDAKNHRMKEVSAPRLVNQSFLIDPETKTKIGINHDALEKEFLLQGVLSPQAVVSNFHSLKSRIVAFRKIDNYLYMMEATQGHTISKDLPQNFVLTRFRILETKNNVIYFDFAEGMSKIFLASEWRAQDLEGPDYSPSWSSVDVGLSFVESAEIDDKNNLVIRQVAQAALGAGGAKQSLHIEVKYYLTPYVKNPNFQPTVSKDFDRMGFFEIAPQLQEGGGSVVYATKFDVNKPLVYAVSANTPPEYKQAVKDGILYWNKSLGKEVIKVIDAPEGVVAPDFTHNVVQWVNWNDAGFAYADAQMDPRTGETLHAQVFLTSVFGFSSKNKATQIYRKLKQKDSSTRTPGPQVFSIKGFEQNQLCNYSVDEHLLQGLGELLSLSESNPGVDDDIFLRVSQNYVTEVVAHEVGHTLGLRHNFAGSLAANFPQSAKSELFKDYIKNGSTPEGIVASSSVMEYQRFEESTMTGNQLVRDLPPLSYDQKAIQTLYFGKSFDPKEIPLFCTDSHVGVFLDCNRFDGGGSFLEFAKLQEDEIRESVPYILMESYRAAKAKVEDDSDPTYLQESTLNLSVFAATALSSRLRIIQALQAKPRLLSVERAFSRTTSLHLGDVHTSNRNKIAELFKAQGGVSALLAPVPLDEGEKALDTFKKLLQDPSYTKVMVGETQKEFSEAEKLVMTKEAEAFFSKLPLYYMITDMKILSSAENIEANALGHSFAELLFKRALFIINATIRQETYEIVNPAKDSKQPSLKINLPIYAFPVQMRILAAKYFNDKSDDILWGKNEKGLLLKFLKLKLDGVFGVPLSSVDPLFLPVPVARWVYENQKLLDSFSDDDNSDSEHSGDFNPDDFKL